MHRRKGAAVDAISANLLKHTRKHPTNDKRRGIKLANRCKSIIHLQRHRNDAVRKGAISGVAEAADDGVGGIGGKGDKMRADDNARPNGTAVVRQLLESFVGERKDGADGCDNCSRVIKREHCEKSAADIVQRGNAKDCLDAFARRRRELRRRGVGDNRRPKRIFNAENELQFKPKFAEQLPQVRNQILPKHVRRHHVGDSPQPLRQNKVANNRFNFRVGVCRRHRDILVEIRKVFSVARHRRVHNLILFRELVINQINVRARGGEGIQINLGALVAHQEVDRGDHPLTYIISVDSEDLKGPAVDAAFIYIHIMKNGLEPLNASGEHRPNRAIQSTDNSDADGAGVADAAVSIWAEPFAAAPDDR